VSSQLQDKFSSNLLDWFRINGRKGLPWQLERTPYRVWISEIMLQQTQVTTVIPYFERFIDAFPDVQTLANADIDQVMQHWTGLGYYARARNLHKTANILHHKYVNQFPDNLACIVALPGIGRSTAGAILSIAFEKREPILDGNVKRVLTRYHEIAGWPGNKKIEDKLWRLADSHTPYDNVAEYTQAIMDLGATLCKRSKPECDLCPVRKTCLAFSNNTQTKYPERKPQKILPIKNTVFAIIENKKGQLLLENRPPTGIWGGLWCFPEFNHGINIDETIEHQLHTKCVQVNELEEVKHTFSHFHLIIKPLHIKVDDDALYVKDKPNYQWLDKINIELSKGLPKPVLTLLNHFKH